MEGFIYSSNCERFVCPKCTREFLTEPTRCKCGYDPDKNLKYFWSDEPVEEKKGDKNGIY